MRIVHVININKSYGNHTIFKNFSMEVEENEFLVIEGKSGSGKSTLLNMIGLLDRPDQGDIELFGHTNVKPFTKKAQHILSTQIGYLFQNYALIEDKNVSYNMNLAIDHLNIKDKDELISNALKQVGLEGYKKKPIYECSGGEQQRIAIARLLIKPCNLILADEPTGSLDATNKQEIFTLLKNLQKQGKTIVVVSHDPDLITIADRTIKIK